MGEGYSLRHMIVEALLNYKKVEIGQNELNSVVKQLQNLVMSLDKQITPKLSKTILTNSFLDAVRQYLRDSMRVD